MGFCCGAAAYGKVKYVLSVEGKPDRVYLTREMADTVRRLEGGGGTIRQRSANGVDAPAE